MLNHEETLALINQAQLGDDNAKEKLIKENMPLIKSIVKRFKGRLEYDDLMQLGAMGFTKAMMGFDEKFGVRFSTYAVPMITGEIKRFLRDDGVIKVSRYSKNLAYKISAYIDEQEKSGTPSPTIDELAKIFDCEPNARYSGCNTDDCDQYANDNQRNFKCHIYFSLSHKKFKSI